MMVGKGGIALNRRVQIGGTDHPIYALQQVFFFVGTNLGVVRAGPGELLLELDS